MEQQREHVFGTGQGHRLQSGLTSLPSPPEATSTNRSAHSENPEGEPHGHSAAQGVADQGDPLLFQHGEQVSDPARVGTQRVVATGLSRLPAAKQVGGDHCVMLGQAGMTARQVVELPATPRTSRIVGPSPAIRELTRVHES